MEITKEWGGKFGKEYTDRSVLTPSALDEMYKNMYGVTALELNESFLGRMDRDIRILEVGCNVGNQLVLLKKMRFKNLYGIDINSYAVSLSKSRANDINIIYGSALDIPFRDNYFDLVFTAGVLIHIHPKDIDKAIKEICRCSSKYIWGYEYYSKDYEEIPYRGKSSMMWKADFPALYAAALPGCRIEEIRSLKYLENENMTDVMFLINKKARANIALGIDGEADAGPVLKGEQIHLERLSLKHVSDRYVQWLNDKEVCKESRHGVIRNTLEMTRSYVESACCSKDTIIFAIMTNADKQHIGNISLCNISHQNNSGEISIMIGEKAFWGKGIGAKAYKLVIDYGFNKLNLHRLHSGITVRNKPMIKVAEKVGMLKEGILKDAFFKEGIYIDTVTYAIINPKHKKGA